VTPEGRFYTPHTYIGLAVTALFVGRLLYRVVMLNQGLLTAPPPGGNPLAVYERSPLTLAMFGAIVGYYVLYYVGVLQKIRQGASPAQGGQIEPP
jgi:cytochrome b561